MPLESMTQMLQRASQHHYAVGAFNILDYNSMRAVVETAEELLAPVIIQTSPKTIKLWGPAAVASWAKQLTEQATVPVALHLDHCKDLEFIQQCIDSGWSSVMIDASSMPFNENLATSAKVAEMAHNAGISVEAELGEIVGVEDDVAVAENDGNLADPVKAEKFCRELSLDCFAPAIGTAHGVYKGEPRISFDRIEEIATRTGVPLALHGGTGLSEDVFKRCITLGCAKVNISTQLKYAFIDAFVGYYRDHNTEYNPLTNIDAQYRQLKSVIADNIKIFGSANQAE